MFLRFIGLFLLLSYYLLCGNVLHAQPQPDDLRECLSRYLDRSNQIQDLHIAFSLFRQSETSKPQLRARLLSTKNGLSPSLQRVLIRSCGDIRELKLSLAPVFLSSPTKRNLSPRQAAIVVLRPDGAIGLAVIMPELSDRSGSTGPSNHPVNREAPAQSPRFERHAAKPRLSGAWVAREESVAVIDLDTANSAIDLLTPEDVEAQTSDVTKIR